MNLRIPLLFSKAIDLQVDLIELDVHLSADGELFMTRQLTGQPTERAVNQFSVLELKQFKMERSSVSPLYPKY
jgi:glycerophosphoryl diester phosphodiesterase